MVITTRERQVRQYKAAAKKERKKASKIVPARKILAVAVILSSTACGGFHASICTTEGCRAHNDYATGIINETKTPAGKKGSHYQLREKQTAKPTWYEALLGKVREAMNNE